MEPAVLSALVTGVLSLVGVIITCTVSNNKIQQQLQLSMAVTDTKIEELTREVREHNNFARRVPVIEEKVARLEAERRTA